MLVAFTAGAVIAAGESIVTRIGPELPAPAVAAALAPVATIGLGIPAGVGGDRPLPLAAGAVCVLLLGRSALRRRAHAATGTHPEGGESRGRQSRRAKLRGPHDVTGPRGLAGARALPLE